MREEEERGVACRVRNLVVGIKVLQRQEALGEHAAVLGHKELLVAVDVDQKAGNIPRPMAGRGRRRKSKKKEGKKGKKRKKKNRKNRKEQKSGKRKKNKEKM